MAQRAWKTTSRPPEEIIETCSSVRNELLRKSGYSPAQWFLGQDPKHAGWLADVDEQRNFAAASQILSDQTFQERMRLRDLAAQAFIHEHSKDCWRRAIAGRNRPMRGPYVQGQLVYFFRRRGRGQLSTRHGVWMGPGRIIGLESSTGHFVPRVIWVSHNGFLYKCSPETLRPIPEDEQEFRDLTRDLAEGRLHPDIVRAEQSLADNKGRYQDLTQDTPTDADFELEADVEEEPEEPERISKSAKVRSHSDSDSEGVPRKVLRRYYRSSDYWRKRSMGAPPLGTIQEGDVPHEIPEEPPFKRRVAFQEEDDDMSYEPSILSPDEVPDAQASVPEAISSDTSPSQPVEQQSEVTNDAEMQPENPSTQQPEVVEENLEPLTAEELPRVPSDDEFALEQENIKQHVVLEVSLDISSDDITNSPLFLWGVIEECFELKTSVQKKRRVEVSFRKLSPSDKKLFEQAMQKEWNSWIENKVTSLCKSRGIPTERIIKARWVLVWKKSSDPDQKEKTPKARLVLVGWQDPELGKIATDSPTLRKESKSLVLSLWASRHWKLWGADIKTAFLSGDPSQRNIYFRPPPEIRQWMNLSEDDLFRLEKAAYGLAEAPRAWFLRTREMQSVGLRQSQLDPCLFTLTQNNPEGTVELLGACGVHVDDILGGGSPAMDDVLEQLRKRLPFGDFRTYTIRYTGVEIRQNPATYCIEIGQETYIDSLEPVQTKTLGTSGTPLKEKTLLRTCAGQLAWIANSTRPDQSFLASYLQGVQDNGQVSHVQMFNKALREMKARKLCLTFPSHVKVEDWRIMAIADAGWGTRSSGDSQGGYLLCLTDKSMIDRKKAACWLVDWSSKKLRRVVRSAVAAETLAGQNGLDAIEFFQALLAETLYGMTPRQFRDSKPEFPACLVVDSKGFYDAVTRSCCSAAISLERILMIDYSIATETLSNQNILIFWVNNLQMAADPLTKLRGDVRALFDLLETRMYHIKVCTESGRKESARKATSEVQQSPDCVAR